MMRISKKIVLAALACTLCMGSLTSCGDGARVIFTTGFGKNEIFRIEDESCTTPELMVYLTTTQNQYENVYGEEIWNTSLEGMTLEENVKETVLAKIAQIKTMYLLAKDKGIVLEESEEQLVVQAAAEYFGALKEEEIERMDVTEDIIEGLYREYAMADKVYHHIIQDINPEISDDEARTITVQHIFFQTYTLDSEGNRVPVSEERRTAIQTQAQEVYAMAVDGEHDFAELAARYSQDSTITVSFGKGEMEQTIEDAAFGLANDEISPVVETESGYHIFKCLSTFNREVTDANKLAIVEQRRKEVFGQEYDEFVAALARSLNEELWESITLIHDKEVTTDNFFDIYAKYFS